DVRQARLLDRRASRARRVAHRRGARGGRRRVPAEMPRPYPRAETPGCHDHLHLARFDGSRAALRHGGAHRTRPRRRQRSAGVVVREASTQHVVDWWDGGTMLYVEPGVATAGQFYMPHTWRLLQGDDCESGCAPTAYSTKPLS